MFHKNLLFILLSAFVFNLVPINAFADSFAEDFAQIRADEEPESLTRDNTYYISNENELYVYYDLLKSKNGGLYIGVGGEQNYLFAGWGKPDLMILFDFDTNIPRMHNLYGLIFKKATNKEDFITYWSKESKKKIFDAINEGYDNNRTRAQLKATWRRSRKYIEPRLNWIKRKYNKKKTPTFLTDDQQYSYVANLWKNGKVFAIRGDLTKDKTMQDISKFAKKNNMLVKVAYFSNAEYYFKFKTGNFRNNISSLPADDSCIVINTIASTQKDYFYIYTPTPIYNAWVNKPKYVTRWRVNSLYRLKKYIAKQVSPNYPLYVVSKPPSEYEKK